MQKDIRVHILNSLIGGPTGGANQFLKALKKEFEKKGCYSNKPEEANVVLFNSYPFGEALSCYSQLLSLKRNFSDSILFVHRVDGPVSVVRGHRHSAYVDSSIQTLNQVVADATVFQSEWSKKLCEESGISENMPSDIIQNAPDPEIFFPKAFEEKRNNKLKIIISSWSRNWRKGFDVYKFLDQQLDFSKYEVRFVGNSPIEFNNIINCSAKNSEDLAVLLRNSDIFLTASVDDPCSNSLIEAMHSGLLCVVRNSGGHPEILNGQGFSFEGVNDVIDALDQCAIHLPKFNGSRDLKSISSIADQYLDFFASQIKTQKERVDLSLTSQARVMGSIFLEQYMPKISRRVSRIMPVPEAEFYPKLNNGSFISFDGSEKAKQWVKNVNSKMPVFINSLRIENRNGEFKYSCSGDIKKTGLLTSSVFAAKLLYMVGEISQVDRLDIAKVINSFLNNSGAIFDPWLEKHSLARRIKLSLITRNVQNLSHAPSIRAETRQSYAALRCLGEVPKQPYEGIPRSAVGVKKMITSQDWSRPWAAASHLSHVVFFYHYNKLWFDQSYELGAKDLLEWAIQKYTRNDGAWYKEGANVSLSNKVNGAMKMVTAFNVLNYKLDNVSGLIDLCLSAVNDKHACNHLNVICVLQYCSKLSDYRAGEIHEYCIDRLEKYTNHYWSAEGGFSFYENRANDVFYNARVTTGMAEPDIHGTLLMFWGVSLLVDILGWNDEISIRKPYT